MTITLEEIKADLERVAEKVAGFERSKPRTINLQHTAIVLAEGEVYAGLLLKDDGTPSHHLVLLAGEHEGDWASAKVWAKKAGGELPTRREQSLLFANARTAFQERYYWSSEAHTNGSYAWMQGFNGGSQDWYDVDSEYCARAVRRVFA
ncbi:MAG: hypothetical protein PVS3B2_00560 [Candidatus Dormibacteraceae bacterium]